MIVVGIIIVVVGEKIIATKAAPSSTDCRP
jgi:hypothetical protein